MPRGERVALAVSDDLAHVDHVVPPLRKANVVVRRVLGVPAAVKLTQEFPFDLVVLVLPLGNAREFVSTIRAQDSQCRRAGVLVVLNEATDPQKARALTEQGSRVLPPASTAEEIEREALLLVRVAPRVPVKA